MGDATFASSTLARMTADVQKASGHHTTFQPLRYLSTPAWDHCRPMLPFIQPLRGSMEATLQSAARLPWLLYDFFPFVFPPVRSLRLHCKAC